MSRSLRLVLVLFGTWALVCLIACGAHDATVAPAATPTVQLVAAPEPAEPPPELAPEVAVAETGDLGPIPVTSADPFRGRRDALVTLVEFADFQCPFCGRVEPTLAKLAQDYGPAKLRVVWKNNPLAFHPKARPTATMAALVHQQHGDAGFWQLHDEFFRDQARLDEVMAEAAVPTGATVDVLKASPDWARAGAKVDADEALALTIGATGIPAFYANGVHLSGAQPYEKFAALIDEQIERAKDALAHGTPRGRLYVELTKAQFKPVPAAPKTPVDDRPRRIPIGTSPVRGKGAALVTIVEFADFQCPFCGRVVPTLKQLEADYGDQVRFVFKHNPLPFHPRAKAAANFALEARAQQGDRGFWAAHDLLFAKECIGSPGAASRDACMNAGGTWMDHQSHLEDADLAGYARTLNLNPLRVAAAVAKDRYAGAIEDDENLGDDAGASGTPHFFINGRRLVGAQPLEVFKKVIDEELVRANEIVAAGVPRAQVYERLQASAVAAVLDVDKRVVPAPTAASPSRGPANAKVVIQMFADFQCPFCKRVLPTIEALEKAYPGKIRVVWRNLPLPFHANAPLAAEAALEAFRQKGNAGFWGMHALLFENQGNPGGIERQAMEVYVGWLGLDRARFSSALDANLHKPEVDADVALAHAAGLTGTPAFLINGYFVSGAVPLHRFRRVVERALAEAR